MRSPSNHALIVAGVTILLGCASSRGASDAASNDANTPPVDASEAEDARNEDARAERDVSCDRRSLLCRRAEPVCPEGLTASVVDACYGECVPIDTCRCTEAEACPHAEQYTCHLFRQRCGPYL